MNPVPATSKDKPFKKLRGFFIYIGKNYFPMDFVIYVLWSQKYQKRYVGMTSNLIDRFRSHNSLSKKGWTIKFRPWRVVHVEFYTTKKNALDRERFLKTGRGREWMDLNLNMEE